LVSPTERLLPDQLSLVDHADRERWDLARLDRLDHLGAYLSESGARSVEQELGEFLVAPGSAVGASERHRDGQ
jgi:hypothetical protein